MIYILQNTLMCQGSQLYNFDPSILPTLSVFIPQQGINNYAQNAVDQIKEYIEKAQIGQVKFDVAAFQFQLNDINVQDVEINEINIILPDQNQQAIINIKYCKLQFQFSMKETIYPYITDSGSGYIDLNNMQVIVYANPFVEGPTEDNCFPYQHLNANFSNLSSVYIQDMKIIFDSNYSYIYNGLLDILQNVIIQVINEEIGPQILKSALQAAVDGISGGWCICRLCGQNDSYGTGFIYQNFKVENSILKTFMSGQYASIVPDENGVNNFYFIGYNESKLQETILINSDFIYYIEKQNWETGINENLGKQINVQIKCLKYVNNGALIAYGNSVYLVKFKEYNNLNNEYKITIKTDITQNSFYGCLDKNGNIITGENLDCKLNDEVFQQVQDFYNFNSFNIVNSYGMDYCYFKYQDDNNMIMSCQQIKN